MELNRDLFLYVDKLPNERQKDIIRLLYGIDDGRRRTLLEVGQLFGVSSQRIRQLRDKAIRHLTRVSTQDDTFLTTYKTFKKIDKIKKLIEYACENCKHCSSPLNKNEYCYLSTIYKIIEESKG